MAGYYYQVVVLVSFGTANHIFRSLSFLPDCGADIITTAKQGAPVTQFDSRRFKDVLHTYDQNPAKVRTNIVQ